ncbi:hypothetical protein JTB14_003352 [Gonioctena quinquepunctata]|nr:hypothetical protein JTB14_003352 [Gonioctena quinquepunctata]
MSEFNVSVRKAVRDDMIQVFGLIKELADFEKLGEKVKIDYKTLQEDGFGKATPDFECTVAELDDGRIVGYALFFYSYSTWLGKFISLEDLYVQEKYRSKGVGRQLLLSVVKIAKEQHFQKIDFNVLTWNPAIEFYKRLGAINLSETENWLRFRLDQDSINKLV